VKILVTDGNSRAALAICRSLGAKGHHVIVGDHHASSLAAASKYCKDRCIYPNPGKHPAAFLNFLEDYVKHFQVDILIPATDITTLPITEHKARFEPSCKVPFADFAAISRAANKVDIMLLAQSLGVDIPKSVTISSSKELKNLTLDFPFPVVIKPGRSRVLTENGYLYTSVSYAEDLHSLTSQLQQIDPLAFPVLIQERINGPGVGIFMCYQNGNPIAAFSHQRLREKPPSGGVSVLRESIPLDPIALSSAEKLLCALHWNGVAMVEFKRDERDGKPKLMEINGRFWGSLQLAIDAGVDFPNLLVESTQQQLKTNYDYNLGVKSRWLYGDFDALLLRLFKHESALQLPPGSPSKMKYLRDFLRFREKNMKYEICQLNDMNPWLFESWLWLHDLLGFGRTNQ